MFLKENGFKPEKNSFNKKIYFITVKYNHSWACTGDLKKIFYLSCEKDSKQYKIFFEL